MTGEAAGPADGHGGPAEHDAADALDGLQRSALEAIDAARGVLDAAELLVRDPKVAGEVLGALAALGRGAIEMLARQTPAPAQGDPTPADGMGEPDGPGDEVGP